MALEARGAEAVVTACEWHGRPAVAKHRNRRSYRHPDLEARLVAERLRAEARLLGRAAEAGLPPTSPEDLRRADASIRENAIASTSASAEGMGMPASS